MNIDYDNLPKELLDQLSTRNGPAAKRMEHKTQILDLLTDNGPMSKDELLVGLWQVNKEILKRHALTHLLSTMIAKGDIRRAGYGVYALPVNETGEQPNVDDTGAEAAHTTH